MSGDTVSPKFVFQPTEDPACYSVAVMPFMRTVGWVCRFPLGWGYRASEIEVWNFGWKRRSEAAQALYAAASRAAV